MRCDVASRHSSVRSRRAGYTLLELVIVLVILFLITAIAVPPLQSVVRSTRLETGRQTFIGDLRLARTEAIRRNRSVDVTLTGQRTYTIQYIGPRTLQEGVTFTGGPTTIRFAPFGPLMTGMTTYMLRLDGRNTVVRLSASGNVSAQ